MKRISILFLSFFIIEMIFMPTLYGQSTGDYQSAASGNWGDLATWQTWNGSAWVAATSIPDSTSSALVTVLSPHNVTVAATIGVRNVLVNAGASVTVSGGTVILYIALEGMTVNGILTLSGNVPTAAPFSITKTTGTLIIGNGGVVNYNQSGASTSDKGALPTATWQTGSTLNVNSTGGIAATGWNAGGGQNFYNINWNCLLMTGSFGWGFTASTVGGTVSILNTNTGRLQFFGGSSGTLNIMGNFIVSGASGATINGSSTGGTFDTINVYGKVNVNTTGNFSVSRGSQGGTGKSIFNFYGDSVKIIAGAMNNSTTLADGAKFIFKKNGTQFFTLTPTAVTGNALPIEVDAGSTVVLTSPVNVTTLYLNGGVIVSSTVNPLIMGWWSGSSLINGTVSSTAPGSATSYVSGPMSFLNATAGLTIKTYPIGKGGIYRPLTLSFTQTAATISTYTAEMINSTPSSNTFPGTLDKVSSMRYYSISEGSGGSAFTAGSVILNYSNDDGVYDAANLRIAQGPVAGGGLWVDLGGTGTAITTGNITSNSFTDLTTNTIFTLANNAGGSNSLPVELTSFTASSNGRKIQISWTTKTEVNSNKFEIERSLYENQDWVIAGSVKASGTINTPRNYSYIEKNTQAGKYQYRLKMIDNNGSYKYSNIIEAEIAVPKAFAISQNYPNPFNPSTKIDYQVPVDSKVLLEVYNIAGQKVMELVNKEQSAGYYTVDFGSTKLSSGVYIYHIAAAGKAAGNNFTSIKKMILMK
jgi:hypothetical protein